MKSFSKMHAEDLNPRAPYRDGVYSKNWNEAMPLQPDSNPISNHFKMTLVLQKGACVA